MEGSPNSTDVYWIMISTHNITVAGHTPVTMLYADLGWCEDVHSLQHDPGLAQIASTCHVPHVLCPALPLCYIHAA